MLDLTIVHTLRNDAIESRHIATQTWYRSSSWIDRPWVQALATAEFTCGLQHPRPKTVTR
ncbi:hypothetical protein YC2023_014702 [Brassica napus]